MTQAHKEVTGGPGEAAIANLTVRSKAAQKIVDGYVKWAAGAGLIPFPYVDLAAVAAVQYRMLSKLAELYDMPFGEQRTKSLISAVLGGAIPADLAWGPVGSTLKFLPVVGTIANIVAMPVFAGASTYAVGRVFIQHFESGGTFLTFDPAAVKEYFAKQMAEGKDMLSGKKPAPSA